MGIHTNIKANEIKDDLFRKRLKVVEVAQMTTRRGPKKPLPLYREKVENRYKVR